MTSQLMTQLNNTKESEKYQQKKGNDYTTGCLLDFAYFKKKLQINCS